MSTNHGPGYLEICDLCHDPFPLMSIIFTGKQFLCLKCYGNNEESNKTIINPPNINNKPNN